MFPAQDMSPIQVSQCFINDSGDSGEYDEYDEYANTGVSNVSCTVCGSPDSSKPNSWISVQCHDTRPSTRVQISVQHSSDVKYSAEKLLICGVEIIGRKLI